MHVLVTGGTGFIGTALVPALVSEGYRVTVLTRQQRDDTASVAYVQTLMDVQDEVDAVINLAGASLADKRWNQAYKTEMLASRVDTTRQLVQWMAEQDHHPGVLLSGSAIGFYGASDDATFNEQAKGGAGFAADLCQQWERAALEASDLGTRVVLLRLGVVFDRDGGALTEMLRSFQMGIGSWVGSGRQWLSWIHRWDVVRAVVFLLRDADAAGPFNLTAPEPVTHRQFCDIASQHKRVFAKLGVPGFVLKAMVGEMADELLLSGQRVEPAALQERGFTFALPTLDDALGDIHSAAPSRRTLS